MRPVQTRQKLSGSTAEPGGMPTMLRPRRASWAIALLGVVGLSLGLSSTSLAQGLSQHRHAETFTSIDFPGSIETRPSGINPAGQIVGEYRDVPGGNTHGFLREPDGTFVSFACPGATAGTGATAINPVGQIVGNCLGPGGPQRGFVRDRDGTMTLFDFPGSLTTSATAINPAGQIVGTYADTSSVFHGFLRSRQGAPTTKDECKNGGWETFEFPRAFKNQGDCIQFVNTGK